MHNPPPHNRYDGIALLVEDVTSNNNGKQIIVQTRNGTLVYYFCKHTACDLFEILRTDVQDPNNPLTWYEAAVISHQVTKFVRETRN